MNSFWLLGIVHVNDTQYYSNAILYRAHTVMLIMVSGLCKSAVYSHAVKVTKTSCLALLPGRSHRQYLQYVRTPRRISYWK